MKKLTFEDKWYKLYTKGAGIDSIKVINIVIIENLED